MTHFEIKNRIDNLIYKIYNIYSDIKFFFKFSEKSNIQNNKKYLNINENKRCFIIGTGPSINELDDNFIKYLKKEDIIAVNSFFKIEKLCQVTPKYYALIDDVFWRESWVFGFKDVLNHYKNGNVMFITDYRSKKILDNLEFSENTIFLHSKKFPASKISCDISKNLHVGINVISSCIQTALFLGYKEIYLLGCDYNSFATIQDEHAYDDSDEIYEIKDRLGMLLSFYTHATRIHYLLRDLANQRMVKIINLTQNSLLDAYPKKNISDIFI